MPLFILSLAVLALLVLISVLRINAFVSLVIVAVLTGLAEGMPLKAVLASTQKGMGDTLGSLAMVLGFGVMFGRLLSETGVVQRISSTLIARFGLGRIRLAMMITGFAIGAVMFYNAGFILLLPLVFAVSRQTGLPLIYLGIPTAAALSVTHGFLPPHPGPSAIAVIFQADPGKVLLYGILLAIPAIGLAGWLLPGLIRNLPTHPPEKLYNLPESESGKQPGFWLSLGIALIPVLLMAASSIVELLAPARGDLKSVMGFLGDPGMALLIALLLGLLLIRGGRKVDKLMGNMAESVESVALILLIIGAGGAFKQVLVDSGIGDYIADIMTGARMSPLLLGWLVATLIRVALGSATVAGLTAAGIVQPLVGASGADPALMVLAIGAGSLMLSHVNDTGFWMFKEYFGLSVRDTFRSWTVMETIVGVTGLIGVLILEQLI